MYSGKFGVRESEDQVVRSCAREVGTILDIGPRGVRFLQEAHSLVGDVLELTVIEEMRRNLVRLGGAALEGDVSHSARSGSKEALEGHSLDIDSSTPVTLSHRLPDR